MDEKKTESKPAERGSLRERQRLKFWILAGVLSAAVICIGIILNRTKPNRIELYATAENGEITRESMIELAKEKICQRFGEDTKFVSELDYEYKVITEKGKERAEIPVVWGAPVDGEVTVMLCTVYLNSDSNSVMTAGIGGVPVPHWETEEERGNQQNESDK